MPITLPNLDDRRFDDLVEEALARIPAHAPEWTNYNESDPGITLVELFAYLTEMLLYRQNRISDANVCSFLKLMDGVKRTPVPGKAGYVIRDRVEVSLENEVRQAVQTLRTQDRAVTCQDFEELALKADDEQRVARAHCLPRRFLKPDDPSSVNKERSGHVTVVIVPRGKRPDEQLLPDDALVKTVSGYLSDRRLLTTRVNVSGPRYLEVAVHVTLVLKPDAGGDIVKAEAENALEKFFDPLSGGADGKGWPLGRAVYVSEVYALLDRLPGVDYVTTAIDPKTGNPLLNEENQPYPELTVIPDNLGRRIPSPSPFDGVFLRDEKKAEFIDVTRESAEGGAQIPLSVTTQGLEQILLIESKTVFDSIRFILSKPGKGYELRFMVQVGPSPSSRQNKLVDLREHGLTDNTADLQFSGLVTFKPPPDWVLDPGVPERYSLGIYTRIPPTEVAVADLIVRGDDKQVTEGIRLEADELVAFSRENSHLQIIDPKIRIAKPLLLRIKAGRYKE